MHRSRLLLRGEAVELGVVGEVEDAEGGIGHRHAAKHVLQAHLVQDGLDSPRDRSAD